MGISWALEKTKMWTLGNPSLHIFTDHKPIIGLLKKKKLDEVDNPRLVRLIQKTMRWVFNVHHVSGLDNNGPDALSRYPWGEVPLLAMLECVMSEPGMDDISNEDDLQNFNSLEGGVLTWNKIQQKTKDDLEMTRVMTLLENEDYDKRN